jgi:lysine 2,3-aminomutase
VGPETELVHKKRFLPVPKQWESRLAYIEQTPSIRDVIVSGGDSYLLEAPQLRYIGERLLSIPHIQRFRFASKGLSTSPSRLIDPNDDWVDAIIQIERKSRKMGKHVCIHTHINHPNEITWVTRRGAHRLYENGVTVRNQSVLLNGVNNNVETMKQLVHTLADMNIVPVSSDHFYCTHGNIFN